jgi:hypothetical protein
LLIPGGKRSCDLLLYDGSVGHPQGVTPARQESSEDCPALAADPFKPLELGQWLRVIVDAQVEV